jgi:hypothetical protein
METLVRSFKDKIVSKFTWWLKPSNPFIINDEYSIKLVHIDKTKNMVKIEVTNLKNNQVVEFIQE